MSNSLDLSIDQSKAVKLMAEHSTILSLDFSAGVVFGWRVLAAQVQPELERLQAEVEKLTAERDGYEALYNSADEFRIQYREQLDAILGRPLPLGAAPVKKSEASDAENNL